MVASFGTLAGVIGIIVFFSPNLTKNAFAILTASLLPKADGFHTAWGGSGYTAVDEPVCNGTLDYVFTSSTSPINTRESYVVNTASIPTSTITKITITPCASGNTPISAVSSTINVFYRYNGQDSALKGNYKVTGTIPVTLASSVFNNLFLSYVSGTKLEIGVQYASGTSGARMSKIAATMNYAVPVVASGTPLQKDGTYKGWDFYDSSGVYTENFEVVQVISSSTCNGLTDYVYTTTPGARDSYLVDLASANIPANAFVTNIDVIPCASLELCPATNQQGLLTSSMSVFYRLNGIDSVDSAPYNVPVGTVPVTLSTTSFAVPNLKIGSISELQVGAVFNSGSLGARLSGLQTRVTYIVPDP